MKLSNPLFLLTASSAIVLATDSSVSHAPEPITPLLSKVKAGVASDMSKMESEATSVASAVKSDITSDASKMESKATSMASAAKSDMSSVKSEVKSATSAKAASSESKGDAAGLEGGLFGPGAGGFLAFAAILML
ncbi:uncharacterized protein J8A68_003624 [[Candida] subhashii]|uniref:Uncharacterized protein n=1 Tax=[Candida] subhashii TaxID=561895 RepID=A0A8J5UY61_9ASCO|nr:uncharacterized protein J8A68_003624 [[Candida] subhashii]KAG7662854.1 hypothetical protein J8A68_003624 [[Candida] subhashii]